MGEWNLAGLQKLSTGAMRQDVLVMKLGEYSGIVRTKDEVSEPFVTN
jgi:hypothetical protein